MLKDRKFWTGLLVGTFMMGSVSLVLPTNAAEDAMMKKVLKVMIEMVKEQRKTNQMLGDIKQVNTGTTNAIKQLAETQTFNKPPSAGR